MCTLSWAYSDGGYIVAFSRDERRTRALGQGPVRSERGGVALLAPIDGEAGGTWLCANEWGVTLALLNGYRFLGAGASDTDTRQRPSRGALVLELADIADAAALDSRMARLDLEPYRPFELAAFDAGGCARLSTWDGMQLSTLALALHDRPLVSSSFDDAGARRERRALFAGLQGSRIGEAELVRFHASHEPARGAHSPCMHRDEAHTVSFTRVRVGADAIELLYQPQSPCAGAAPERALLARRKLAPALPPLR